MPQFRYLKGSLNFIECTCRTHLFESKGTNIKDLRSIPNTASSRGLSCIHPDPAWSGFDHPPGSVRIVLVLRQLTGEAPSMLCMSPCLSNQAKFVKPFRPVANSPEIPGEFQTVINKGMNHRSNCPYLVQEPKMISRHPLR